MRTLLALTLFTAACTSASPSGGPSHDSVRDRLADGPTRLHIGSNGSSGTITARRWTPDGWIEGVTAMSIANGELSASLDASGKLSVGAFEVGVDPIEIPMEVFNKPAQLSDVRIRLAAPISTDLVWTSDDDATGTLSVALDLDWAIAVNNGKTPLGTQHLPPVLIDVMITGGGDHIDASIGLHAAGELWDWAGLLELTSLEMALSAATLD